MKPFLVFVILGLSVISCKQEQPVQENPPVSTVHADSTPPKPAPAGNPNLAANMSWTFLTDQLFHHDATVTSGKPDPNVRKGHWMDFSEDGTYTYGVWDKNSYTGTWSYNNDTKVLLLQPSDPKEKTSEWRVHHNDNTLVLAGTATYGDNANQIRWMRHAEKPDPNAKKNPEDEDQ